MKTNGQIILGIEAAINGGSLSIYCDGSELGYWSGTDKISRAEHLMPNLDRILDKCSLTPNDIELIVVSRGPGSFTGIRIGIATAMGLRSGILGRCLAVTALEALAWSFRTSLVTAAVPVGRQFVGCQDFLDGKPSSEPQLISEPTFFDRISQGKAVDIVLPSSLYKRTIDELSGVPRLIDCGPNIARLLCLAWNSPSAGDRLEPLFLDRSK